MSEVVAVIPARFGSTRLPGKPLLARTGRPLVVHVAERAAAAATVDRVLIATDDQRIVQAVEAHGYEAVMTRPDHPNGTSRIAEVAEHLPASVTRVVNVQGDEPMIAPALIDAVVKRLDKKPGDKLEGGMATVASPFGAGEDASDPNVVKVVLNQAGQAMYFSRARIPHDRDGTGAAPPLKHVGLYAYRRDFLPRYVALSPTPAEEAEQLEQLRALEHGYTIGVVVCEARHQGIDTPAQYEAFVAAMAAEAGTGGAAGAGEAGATKGQGR